MIEVPLDPEGAAAHARVIQGGFSTPEIEAFRIIEDARRMVNLGHELDARWRKGVVTTLNWIEEHKTDPMLQREKEDYIARLSGSVTYAETGVTWEGIEKMLTLAAEGENS